MEKLIIQGGNRLEGRVRVSSAKNAVLPIIAGTLLASTPSKLLEIPNLEDVGTICQVIESLGLKSLVIMQMVKLFSMLLH